MDTKNVNLTKKTKAELVTIANDLVGSLDKANLKIVSSNLKIATLEEEARELNSAIARLKLNEEKLEAANKALSTSNKNYVNALAKDAEEYNALISKKSMWQFLALFFMLSTIVTIVFSVVR